MAIAKLTDSKSAVIFVDNDNNQFITSVRFLQGLLNGRSPRGFLELNMLPTKAPEGKWRRSPVYAEGRVIPYEEYFGPNGIGTKQGDAPSVDLMNVKVRASKRAKESFKVDDNVW